MGASIFMAMLCGVLACAILAFGVWVLICNERTARHRHAMIKSWKSSDDFWAAVAVYNRVTYEQHLWALVCFRDVKKLYSIDMAGDAK